MPHHLVAGFCVALLLSSSAIAKQNAPTLDVMREIGQSIVSKKCSHPEKIAKVSVKNRYIPSVTDEIQTYTCRGFVVEVYHARVMNVTRELPRRVVVSRQLSFLPRVLSVGAHAVDVLAALGDPFRRDGENLVYSLSDEDFPGVDTLTFNVSASRVRLIEWNWSVE
jgi:hypothetical protein